MVYNQMLICKNFYYNTNIEIDNPYIIVKEDVIWECIFFLHHYYLLPYLLFYSSSWLRTVK